MAVNDEIWNNLAQYGGGSINERVYNYLGSLGFTGSLSDRLSKFSSEGRNGWQGLLRAWGQWKPAQLFSQGQQGVWYEPKPVINGQQILYQDSAGTTPVTADGQPVGYMQDLSGNGNHAIASATANKPVYRTDGTLHWLEFDGIDDVMKLSTTMFDSYPFYMAMVTSGVTTNPLSISSGNVDASDQLVGLQDASGSDIVRAFTYNSTFTPVSVPSSSINTIIGVFASDGVSVDLNDGEEASEGAAQPPVAGANVLTLGATADSTPVFGDGNGYGFIAATGDLSGKSSTAKYLANLAGVTL